MVFVLALQSEAKLHRRIGGALDTPAECDLPRDSRELSCNRRWWTVLAWKSSGTGRNLRKRTREEEEGRYGKLVGRQEEVLQTQTRPADRTSFSGKTDGSTLHAPAKPGKKLLLFALDQHRSTSDTESTDNRFMRVQFASEPVSPGRHSGDPVNMGERGPNESVFRACQQSSS